MRFAIAAALLSLPWPFSPAGEVVERRIYVMGTLFSLRVEAAHRQTAATAAEAAVRGVEELDRVLSTWDPASPLSALNAAPLHHPLAADRKLIELLAEAEAWARRTGRAFDPTVGALVDVWDLRGGGRVPTESEVVAARARVGAAAMSVDLTRGTVTRNADGAWLDTGGFGKGAALRVAADSLRGYGVHRALLDLGGQLLALAASTEEPWSVGVAHPARREEIVATLRLHDASVATSGNSERGLAVDGVRIGHILDPRHGTPVPWWGSVTVVSGDPMEADVLSTALYVMGPDAGMAWARDLNDVGVLFLVEADGVLQPLHNQAMEKWLTGPPPLGGIPDTLSPERRSP